MKPSKLQFSVEEARTTPAGKEISGKTVVATHKGSLVGHAEHGQDVVVVGRSLPNQASVDAAHAAIAARAKAEGIESTGNRTV